MSEQGHARGIRELKVYRKAMKVADRVFEVSKTFPREEAYSLTDQIRRSSRSIGAQIAEAWAKRRYERHFVSKLTDADAEQHETRHWVDVAFRCAYLSREAAHQLNDDLAEIGRMLNGMIEKSHLFCQLDGTMVKEEHTDYLVADEAPDN